MRNGPNPYFPPVGGVHWFDGDGLVHSVRLRGDDGPPVYASHFVQTRRLLTEQREGWPCHPKLGDFVGAPGLGILLLDRLFVSLGLDGRERRRHGNGTANTALAHHAGRLLALNEGDLPYALRLACGGLVETIGRVTYGGAFGADGTSGNDIKSGGGGKNTNDKTGSSSSSSSSITTPVTSFTAHPKVDPDTGIMHAFRYTFDSSPYAYYFSIGADGLPTAASADKPHALSSLPRASMMHDFAITKRHAVFFDLPLVFDGARMLKEKQLPFRFAPEHGSRVGLLPFRRAGAEGGGAAAAGEGGSAAAGDAAAAPASEPCDDGVIWYEAEEPFMMFHTAASWEEEEDEQEQQQGDKDNKTRPPSTVKIVVGHHETISLDLDRRCDKPSSSSSTSASIPDAEKPHMAMVTLDPATRRCSVRRLTKIAGDFPVINPRYTGRKCRWVWYACLNATPGQRTVKWDGIAKLDLSLAEEGGEPPEECVVGRIRLPEGVYCGEAVFAPRYEDPALCKGEDDGWLLTFVHDEREGAGEGEGEGEGEGKKDGERGAGKGEGGGSSWFYVFDARTMSSEPLAAFRLPSRVPYGFHGMYAPEAAVQAARVAEAADVL
jgi:carotenoid 9,10(9',10')-cleavage dioxygenase 1